MKKDQTDEEKKIQDLVELGEFYFLNGKLSNALEVLTRARELDPMNVNALYNLGLVYEAKNSFSEARQMYERVLKLEPEHRAAQTHLKKIVGS